MLIVAEDSDFEAILRGGAPGALAAPGSPLAPSDVLEMLRALANLVRESFAPCAWMIVEGREIVGLCSITAAPTCGEIRIGYGVAPTRQGRGCASRAVASLAEWARSDPRVSVIIAETSVDNLPSQRVLKRNGFAIRGERVDAEDGPLLCWRLDLSPFLGLDVAVIG